MPLPRNPNAFANFPLDKAGARRKEEGWLTEALDGARLALFAGVKPLVDDAGAVWLEAKARAAWTRPDAPMVFLGVDASGRAHFAAQSDTETPPRGRFEDMRTAAMRLSSADDVAILGCAKSLFEWHARHGFCANCGAVSVVAEAGWKRHCPACGTEHFPRVDPVVIMLPVFGERCCLGRGARFPREMFSALAGFMEPGETIEEACARELFEETGLVAAEVCYCATQPWPFPSSLMIGLHAEVESETTRIDGEEIVEAIWLTKAEAKAALARTLEKDGRQLWAPPASAIAHHLIKRWAEE